MQPNAVLQRLYANMDGRKVKVTRGDSGGKKTALWYFDRGVFLKKDTALGMYITGVAQITT